MNTKRQDENATRHAIDGYKIQPMLPIESGGCIHTVCLAARFVGEPAKPTFRVVADLLLGLDRQPITVRLTLREAIEADIVETA